MRSKGRVFGLSVSLSVCLSVCPPLFGLFERSGHFQGLIIILYTQQVDQVKKVASRWSTFNRNSLEARKTLVLTRG